MEGEEGEEGGGDGGGDQKNRSQKGKQTLWWSEARWGESKVREGRKAII